MESVNGLKHWSADEDALLRTAVSRGPVAFEAVLSRLEARSPGAVASRLQRLGLLHSVDMANYRQQRYRRYQRDARHREGRFWTRWSAAEDAVLRRVAEATGDFVDLSERLPQRSDMAILGRLRTLGLLDRVAGARPRSEKPRTSRLQPRRPRRQRACMTCRQVFRSEGPHNRLCDDCRERTADLSPYAI